MNVPKEVVFLVCLIRTMHEELAYGRLCEAISSEHQAEAGTPEVSKDYLHICIIMFFTLFLSAAA